MNQPTPPPSSPAPQPFMPDLMMEQADVTSFGMPYLEGALIELELLTSNKKETTTEYSDLIKNLRTKLANNTASWSDLYLIRKHLIQLSTGEDLLGRFEQLRHEFRKIADKQEIEAYNRMEAYLTAITSTAPPPPASPSTPEGSASPKPIARGNFSSDEALRTAANWMLDAQFKIVSYKPRQEKVRSYLGSSCSRTALLYSVVVLAVGWLATALGVGTVWCSPSLMVFVIIAGCIGGYVSSMQRLQQTSIDENSMILIQTRFLLNTSREEEKKLTIGRRLRRFFFERTQLDTFKYSTIYGGIWAIILTMLLASGIISSPVLPDLKSLEYPALQQTYTELASLTRLKSEEFKELTKGKSEADVVKALAWYMAQPTTPKTKSASQVPPDVPAPVPLQQPTPSSPPAETPAPPSVDKAIQDLGAKIGPLEAELEILQEKKSEAYIKLFEVTPPVQGREDEPARQAPFHPFSAIGDFLQNWAGIRFVLKILVWAFIAGFAERFVPDTLDRLVLAQNKP